MPASPTGLAAGPRLRRRSFRLYLTGVYSGLFLGSGAGLLALTYVLAATRFPLGARFGGRSASPGGARGAGGSAAAGQGLSGLLPAHVRAAAAAAYEQLVQQRAAALHSLLVMSGVALAAMTLVSVGLGWLMAGRMLRPLRMVTAAARRISASSLHERLAMTGPDDELRELADTFDALLGRLERAFSAQRQFVANASHELRTPVARQRALIEVALEDAGRTVGSLERACTRVLAAGERQERLIAALLTLAQSQRGLEEREPVDLAVAVREVLAARLDDAQDRGLRVRATLATAPLLGDARLVEQLAANLVSNAIGHNVPGGWIEVGTGTHDGSAILTVANTGPVIPPTEVGRLFEPFQRLGADRAGPRGGVGLGLSIVQAITDAHDGRISAHALAGGGMEIQASFPVIPPGPPAAIL